MSTVSTERGPLATWATRHVAVLVAVTVLAYVVLNLFDPLARNNFIDLDVYRAAGRAVLDGTPLYAGAVAGGLSYNYPPFAAVLFVPLALLGELPLRVLWYALQFALLAFIAHLSLRAVGARGRLLPASLALAGVMIWLEPVTWGLVVGQINLVLIALVMWDLRAGGNRRYQGILVGVAAGTKLVPGLFILYLLATRRFRAAALATGVFAATAGVGALVLPEESRHYWAGAFTNTGRIDGSQLDRSAQSIAATLARLTGSEQPPFAPWLILAVLLGAAGVAIAAWAHRRGHTLLGVALCGLTGNAVSPFAWSHHWVWFVPLTVIVLAWALRRSRRVVAWTAVAVALVLGAWPWGYLTGDRFGPILGTIALPLVRPLDVLYGNLYLWVFLVALVWTAVYLSRTTPVRADRA